MTRITTPHSMANILGTAVSPVGLAHDGHMPTDSLSEDVIRFLSAGTRTGKLGYVAADGRPLIAPVWLLVEDGRLVFNTGSNTAKGRALPRDPRVVLVVDDEHPPEIGRAHV